MNCNRLTNKPCFVKAWQRGVAVKCICQQQWKLNTSLVFRSISSNSSKNKTIQTIPNRLLSVPRVVMVVVVLLESTLAFLFYKKKKQFQHSLGFHVCVFPEYCCSILLCFSLSLFFFLLQCPFNSVRRGRWCPGSGLLMLKVPLQSVINL